MSVYVNEGALIHWWFPMRDLCEEYVTGDTVIGDVNDSPRSVTCEECLEWIHA